MKTHDQNSFILDRHYNASPLSDSGASKRMQSGTGQVLSMSVVAGDGRVTLLQQFMKNTPLYPYATLMVEQATQYDFDYRLIPAIAMCESNLGRRIPSSDSFNPFGIAVYTGQQTGAKFKNWKESILWVSEYIHSKYVRNNIIDIKEIGSIWAPPSIETGHSWAKCVESFMRTIQ